MTELHQNLYDDIPFDKFERDVTDPEYVKERFFPVQKESRIPTMDQPVIIETACPGWQPDGDYYPAVPDTPEETTAELIDSVNAGAAAIHVHPRDETGTPQMTNDELFREVVDPVFEKCGEIITLSHTWKQGKNGHNDYVTMASDLLDAGEGNKYCQGAVVLPPGRQSSSAGNHSLSSIREAVRFYEENDIKPFFQIHDTHVTYDLKHHVFDAGDVTWEPYMMNLNIGKHHTHAIHQNPWAYYQLLTSKGMIEDTFENCIVNIQAGGRNWLPITVLGMLAGATVFRVGVEDTYWLYPHRDDLVPKNSEIVELTVELAEALGREVITDPDKARDYLGLKYTSPQ